MESLLDNKDEFLKMIDKLIKLSLEFAIRDMFPPLFVQRLKELSASSLKHLLRSSSNSSISKEVTPMLKLLRNLCVEMPGNQAIISTEDYVELIVELIRVYCKGGTEIYRSAAELILLEVSIQLLGNCCVNNPTAQDTVWRLCYPGLFRTFLSDAHSVAVNYLCMVLNACIKNNLEKRMQIIQCCWESEGSGEVQLSFFGFLLALKHCEWISVVALELLKDFSLRKLFDDLLDDCSKLSLLNIVLKTDETGSFLSSFSFSQDNIGFLVSIFSNCASSISRDILAAELVKESKLQLTAKSTTTRMLLSILRLLCNSSSQIKVLKAMQAQTSLMRSIVDLLSVMSDFDGSSTSTRNISNLYEKTDIKVPPSFRGVKRDLVQLLGNMCFKCKENQDFMNNHIPLLLNQCKIDHANPFITQWSIWTIRNICDNHPLNQSVLMKLEKTGTNIEELLENNLGCSEVETNKSGRITL